MSDIDPEGVPNLSLILTSTFLILPAHVQINTLEKTAKKILSYKGVSSDNVLYCSLFNLETILI